MASKKKPAYITIEIPFSITIPATSKRNALKLMTDAENYITNELDNCDSLFEQDTIAEVYGADDFEGYGFGFGKAKIV